MLIYNIWLGYFCNNSSAVNETIQKQTQANKDCLLSRGKGSAVGLWYKLLIFFHYINVINNSICEFLLLDKSKSEKNWDDMKKGIWLLTVRAQDVYH